MTTDMGGREQKEIKAVICAPAGSAVGERLSGILASGGISVTLGEDNISAGIWGGADIVIICDGGLSSPAFGLIERIRSNSAVPLMTVSEGCDEIYRTVALHKGADICMDGSTLGRPELCARVAALIRRCSIPPKAADTLENGSLSVDRRSRQIYIGGTPVKMTSTQFGIMEYLMINRGRVCSPEDIYRGVWHENPYDVRRTIVDHIRRIRSKIEPDPKNPVYIRSVSGMGYRLSVS